MEIYQQIPVTGTITCTRGKNHKGTPDAPFDRNESGYVCFGNTLAKTPMQSGIELLIQSRFYIFTPTNRYQLK